MEPPPGGENLLNQFAFYQPPRKKPKFTKKSNTFRHKSDQQQFESLFQSLESSMICKQLKVSSEINKEIAAFGTGKIKLCSGSKCDQEISVLFGDGLFPRDYRYCRRSNCYYCSKCMADCYTHVCGRLGLHVDAQKCSNMTCDRVTRCNHSKCSRCKYDGSCSSCFSCGARFCSDCVETEILICYGCGQRACCDCAVGSYANECNRCYEKSLRKCPKCKNNVGCMYRKTKNDEFLCGECGVAAEAKSSDCVWMRVKDETYRYLDEPLPEEYGDDRFYFKDYFRI